MTDFSKYTILVVDDEESLRETIAFDFQRKGFNVLLAENGKKAFDLCVKNKVDMILSDIRMPGGDGLTLLDEIRKRDPRIPVLILLTGFSDVTEADCIKRGAKTVLSKPFDRKQLMNSVLESLGLAHQKAA